MEKIYTKPFDEITGLDEIRLGKIQQGLGIGVDSFDNYVRWKQGQFNMVNGHDNVGKTDVLLWYFVCMAKLHNKKLLIYSSENTIRSQVFKIFNFWTGKRLDKDFRIDDKGYQRTLNEISDCFEFIPNNKRYSAYDIIDIASKKQHDGLLIDPFNSLMVETGNKHQEDYDICANLRIFASQYNTTVFVNAHLVTQAARNRYPKEHDYEGHLAAPEKADTEGGQKFANRADDFYTVHRMTQHPDRWNIGEIHVRKVKETITGGTVTPRDSPIELRWDNHCKYFIDNINPLEKTYSDVGATQMDILGEQAIHRSKQHQAMSRMSYGSDLDDNIPF
ncbi:MAG: putative bifunctional DNA primase/polymerase [Prokaryotic dsDNA virus sp.]|nr:MAG: putative bifunctional DNA primase/polymerase [Prokaryotic dsDNA virus sp.]|tara:strand:- start:5354 stop:6352 length:999 start_codon:yes stop_codon:yes gene_type:complete